MLPAHQFLSCLTSKKLLQARWFEEGMENVQTMSLRALSIFETVPQQQSLGPQFVNLLQASSMAPLGSDAGRNTIPSICSGHESFALTRHCEQNRTELLTSNAVAHICKTHKLSALLACLPEANQNYHGLCRSLTNINLHLNTISGCPTSFKFIPWDLQCPSIHTITFPI